MSCRETSDERLASVAELESGPVTVVGSADSQMVTLPLRWVWRRATLSVRSREPLPLSCGRHFFIDECGLVNQQREWQTHRSRRGAPN